VTVDNTAPAAPVLLSVDGGETLSSASFSVRWANPGGEVAPVTTAHWRLCDIDGLRCQSGTRTAADIASLDDLSVPESGQWRLSVWLEDAAGNVDPARSTSVSLRYGIADVIEAGPTPQPVATPDSSTMPSPDTTTVIQAPTLGSPIGPLAFTAPRVAPRLNIRSVKRKGGSVVVRGRANAAAAGALRVTVRSGRRVKTVRRWLRAGRFVFSLRSPRGGRVSVRFLGSKDFLPASAMKRFR
jgi:hypothetical protein